MYNDNDRFSVMMKIVHLLQLSSIDVDRLCLCFIFSDVNNQLGFLDAEQQILVFVPLGAV